MSDVTRRKVLTSSVAALAVSALSQEAQAGQAGSAGQFTVRAGEGRPGGQWLVHGDKAFSTKISGKDVGKAYAALEIHTPPGLGPELHIHIGQSEMFYVLKGSVGMQCGSAMTTLKAGDTFFVPPDVPHSYVTLGTEPAHMINVFQPAGDIEAFFAEYSTLVNVDGEPDREKLAAAYAKHGMRVVGPPVKTASFAAA